MLRVDCRDLIFGFALEKEAGARLRSCITKEGDGRTTKAPHAHH